MTPRTTRALTALAVAALALTACGDDNDAAEPSGTQPPAVPDATETTEPHVTTAVTPEGWKVDTDQCVDPDRANAPIEGTIDIASSAPLSGGPAAAAFGPVVDGMKAYIEYANDNGLVPDHELSITVGDDQFNPALTPGVINAALDDGADVITGVIGTPNNAAVRDTLNEECVPQLLAGSGDPSFGDPVAYPWTVGAILPYDAEAKAYAEDIARAIPDGARAAVFFVNNDAGAGFKTAFEDAASDLGIEVVAEQNIEAPDTAPPAPQLSSIASEAPDVIVAFPLGAQCPTFLGELANQKAANPGWEPRIYLTSTCASSLILAIAGESANGLYTSLPSGAVDVINPETHTLPGVAEYLSYMESKGLSDTVPTSATGWIWGEMTVEILRRAAESPDGLTQASIINTARTLEYTPSLVREGFTYKTSGEDDPYYVEAVQVVQYDHGTKYLNPAGELITKFESS